MINTFYALATVFMVHRFFTMTTDLQKTFLHMAIELFYVMWVFAGLFTGNWPYFVTLVLLGQLGLAVEWFINVIYHRMFLILFCILDIIVLLILTLKTIP